MAKTLPSEKLISREKFSRIMEIPLPDRKNRAAVTTWRGELKYCVAAINKLSERRMKLEPFMLFPMRGKGIIKLTDELMESTWLIKSLQKGITEKRKLIKEGTGLSRLVPAEKRKWLEEEITHLSNAIRREQELLKRAREGEDVLEESKALAEDWMAESEARQEEFEKLFGE